MSTREGSGLGSWRLACRAGNDEHLQESGQTRVLLQNLLPAGSSADERQGIAWPPASLHRSAFPVDHPACRVS